MSDTITFTLEHPFFVNNVWVAAKDLAVGDSLFANLGTKVKLDSVFKFKTDTATVVYNFETAGNHNYYVSSGKVLVHNSSIN